MKIYLLLDFSLQFVPNHFWFVSDAILNEDSDVDARLLTSPGEVTSFNYPRSIREKTLSYN